MKSMKPLSKTELTDQMDRILDYAKEYSCVKPKDITRAMIENTINNIEITPVNEKKAEVMIVFKVEVCTALNLLFRHWDRKNLYYGDRV